MKPNANLARQKISTQFNQANIKFWDQVNFLNPEPQVISCFLYFKQMENAKLIRLIKWGGLTENGAVIGKFFDRQELPFRSSLSLVVDVIYEANFQSHLKHSEKITEKLINYKIDEIQWFIKLGTVRDPFAPPMAVKRHDYGLRINMSTDSLHVCFQSVPDGLYFPSDHNLTKVVPVTVENLERVLSWHSEEAKRYLEERS